MYNIHSIIIFKITTTIQEVYISSDRCWVIICTWLQLILISSTWNKLRLNPSDKERNDSLGNNLTTIIQIKIYIILVAGCEHRPILTQCVYFVF